MSAYIVADHHINQLVSYASQVRVHSQFSYYFKGERHPVAGREQEVAQMLLDENTRSVNYRYRQNDKNTIVFRFSAPGLLSSVQALKAIQCLEYQSCECEDFDTSEAKAFLDALRLHAIHRLPGYEEADWELPSDEQRKARRTEQLAKIGAQLRA